MSNISAERLEHSRGDGFTLFTDVNNQLMERLGQQMLPARISVDDVHHQFTTHPSEADVAASFEVDVPPVTLPFDELNVSSSSAALFFVSRQLTNQLLDITHSDEAERTSESFHKQFGITDIDKRKARSYYFDHGFDDTEFAWHFAPALANAVVGEMITAGIISEAQQERFTLGDWANIIGSGWFSSLIHEMTTEKFGAYGIFGKNLADYGKDEFLDMLEIQATTHQYPPVSTVGPAFQFEIVEESGLTYVTAKLSERLARELHAGMDDGLQSRTQERGKTHGCPAARYAGSLSVDAVMNDLHLQSLVAREEMALSPSNRPDRVRFQQEYTTIDRSLMTLAARLDGYDRAYGTPFITHTEHKTAVEHRYVPPTDVLCASSN